jgi:hypothetical protein
MVDDWLQMTADLIIAALLQPSAPWVVAALAGGYAAGAAKNKTALLEIGRAVFVGAVVGLCVWVLQAIIGGA